MSIEQKIAELLAESKAAAELDEAKKKEMCEDEMVSEEEIEEEAAKPVSASDNESNAKNNVDDEKQAEGGTTAKPANVVTKGASAPEASHLKAGMKEDIDALVNGEDLSEEFKTKAATIFEAAVMSRVNSEVTRLEEEFEAKLEEAVAKNVEGLVEHVDGYLNYVVEQWVAQNEIALERGMKSEILEGFVAGLKDLFQEHYIEVPEEKFDVLGSLEEQVEELEAKLNEQVAANVELNKSVGEMKRVTIVQEAADGLTDTEVEKFQGLAEELSYENEETFKAKVKTIRENYFTTKAPSEIQSVVTDTPVESLTESKSIDPSVKRYLQVFDSIK